MLDHSAFGRQLTSYHFYRGRVALYAILKALGVTVSDEVAVQAFTCVAVAEGVMASGATPLYIDTGVDTVNMDARDLARKITAKTRAIVVQHTFGVPAEMDAILAVANAHNIPVIEDCCHTLQSEYRRRRLGAWGAAAFYSFEWGKPLVAGVGGSAIINDSSLEDSFAKVYANFAPPPTRNRLRMQVQYQVFDLLYRPSFYWPVRSLYHLSSQLGVAESSYNPVPSGMELADDFQYRMIDSVKTRLEQKLGELEHNSQHRRQVAAAFRSGIDGAYYGAIAVPQASEIVYARFPLWADDKQSLMEAARKHNVEVAGWYATPVHPLTPSEWPSVHYNAGSCPNAERAATRLISLPTHEKTSRNDVDRTITFLNQFARSR